MRRGLWTYGGLPRRELVRRVWDKMCEDAVWDSAAQLAYYFLLALFPLMIVLLGVVARWRNHNLAAELLETLSDAMPEQAFVLLQGEVSRIMASSSKSLLTFGTVGALWAASSGVVSLMTTLDRIFRARERRGWLHMRATSIGLTIALLALMVTGAVLVTAGDSVALYLSHTFRLALITRVSSVAINYALGLVCLVAALEIALYFGPDGETRGWHWITPGSIAGVLLFVASSWGFSAYLRFNNSYSVTYGSIGAVIVLMLWLYLLGLSILVGAEVNSVIYLARGCAAGGGPPEEETIPPT